MVRPCECNAFVHERCMVECIHHRDSLKPVTCAICKKALPTTNQSRELTVRCSGNVLLLALHACLLAALEAFLIVYVYSFGDSNLWEAPLVVFGILFVGSAITFVCTMLACKWAMYYRSTRRCCWCVYCVPVGQLITMQDGSTIAVAAKRSPCTWM